MRVIAGPCAMESEEIVMSIADALVPICRRLGVELCYKRRLIRPTGPASARFAARGWKRA